MACPKGQKEVSWSPLAPHRKGSWGTSVPNEEPEVNHSQSTHPVKMTKPSISFVFSEESAVKHLAIYRLHHGMGGKL